MLTKQADFDIAVIGGGAAGLMAAVTAAETAKTEHKNISIAVLDGAARVGKKLLATGNGRCNLTNMNMSPSHYFGDVNQIKSVLDQYTPKMIMDGFLTFGLLCKEEDEGRVYPYNVQASAVLDILRRRLDVLKVDIICDFPVTSIQKGKHGFQICSNELPPIFAKQMILAAGGKASPNLGSNGSGFTLAKSLGHSVTPVFPALVQLKTPSDRAKPLKGMRSTAKAVLLADETAVKIETGEVQFTENGLSGICIFQLSRLASEFFATNKINGKTCRSVEISLDFMPEYTIKQIVDLLRNSIAIYPDMPVNELLTGLLNKRVGQEIVKQALPQLAGEPVKLLKVPQLELLTDMIKNFCFPITGTMPWQNAQVTAGGVPLSEVEVSSMRSNICKNLYLAGELLNIDGDCGGYNLHWAWCSGIIAGRSAAIQTFRQKEKDLK